MDYESSIGGHAGSAKGKLTVARLQKAVYKLRDKATVYFDEREDIPLHTVDTLLFRRRPDLILNINPIGREDKHYSAGFLCAVSKMRQVKKLHITCYNKHDLTPLDAMGQLEELYIPTATAVVNISFAGHLRKLRLLQINSKCTGLSSLAGAPNLETVFVYSGSVDFTFANRLSIRHLRTTGYNESYKHVLKPCLKTLALDSIPKLTDIDFLRNCTGLEKLSISQNKITALPDFTPNENLRELYIYSAKSLMDIENLTTLPRLEVISLMDLPAKIDMERLGAILLRLPRLKTVGCEFIDFSGKREKILKRIFQDDGRQDLYGNPYLTIHYDFLDILEKPLIINKT